MTRQLTPIEIEKLFAFVRSKYVRWVDLQYEIVDHLATAIEDTITEDPTISFDRALQQVYSSFPITGFTNLVAAKQKALHRYWIGLAAVAVLILTGMIISLIHKKRNGHFSKQLSEKYLFTSTFLGISAGVTFGVFQLPLQIGSDLIFHNQSKYKHLNISLG